MRGQRISGHAIGARAAARHVAAAVVTLGLALAPAGARTALAATTVDDAYVVDEDTVLVVDAATGMLANDVADTGEEICVLSIDPSGLTGSVESFDSDGRFEYAPEADWSGVTSFTYVLGAASDARCDADAGTFGKVTITVTAVNDRPVAQTDTFQALRDQMLNVAAPGILANDFDVDGDALSAVKESNPAHGTVTVAADGGFSYVPAAGYVGPDGFSYRASDGSETSPVRVVSLTVTALPTPAPSLTPTAAPTAPPPATEEPTPTAAIEASASPGASDDASAGPSTGASPSPGPSVGPGGPVSEGGGLSIPILVIGLLIASLLAFGGAVFLPKWLEARRATAAAGYDDGQGRFDAFDDDFDDEVDDRERR